MVYRGHKTQFVAEIVCVVSQCCLLKNGTGNNLVVYQFLQPAGGCVGRDHHGSPGFPESTRPRLEPHLRYRGGGAAAAAADGCPGTS